MKVAKLVSGIISIVLCPLVLFQSCYIVAAVKAKKPEAKADQSEQ